ncbi:hypothetical protein [Streptomyces sp. NPDC002676]
MAVRDKSTTIGNSGLEVLHISVGRPATVEIREPRDTLALSRKLNAVNIDIVEDQNFTALKRGQTIPWGSIRTSGPVGQEISYRVRTGPDVTGTPEFTF